MMKHLVTIKMIDYFRETEDLYFSQDEWCSTDVICAQKTLCSKVSFCEQVYVILVDITYTDILNVFHFTDSNLRLFIQCQNAELYLNSYPSTSKKVTEICRSVYFSFDNLHVCISSFPRDWGHLDE